MKTFAIIKNDRVSNIVTSTEAPLDATSVEITLGSVSKGFGYTGSTFYEPLNLQINSEDLIISGSDTISLLLNRELNSVLDTSSFTCEGIVDISDFVHDNANHTITFTATTASNSNVGDEAEFKFNNALTDNLGYEWDLNPFTIQIVSSPE